MKSLDLERRKNEKLNDLEEEAKEKAEYLLTKANEMRQEQEDEIKHLNEVEYCPFITIITLLLCLRFIKWHSIRSTSLILTKLRANEMEISMKFS